jgi:imidazole glycerol-phosphate synthase subunit HisH
MIRKVAIIDYGINNISSVEKAFKKIKVETERVRSKEELRKFKHLVLTGVGSFDWGIKNLKSQGLYEEIRNLSKKGHFIMGICLGMQLLFEKSEESNDNLDGLSLLLGSTKKISKLKNQKNLKIPHVGWNNVEIKNNGKIMKDIDNNSNFYFVHSYFVEPNNKEIISATCKHGIEFPAVIESENIIGIQFHPEKCQVNGLKILERFSNFE